MNVKERLQEKQQRIKKENFNSVGAFNSIKDLVEDKEEQVSTPKLQIEIVNNEDLEKSLYDNNN